MDSLDHCKCSWRVGRELHHDHLLGLLRRMHSDDFAEIYAEIEHQNDLAVLPPTRIAVVDLTDFALDHSDELTDETLVLVNALADRARSFHLPEMPEVVLQ